MGSSDAREVGKGLKKPFSKNIFRKLFIDDWALKLTALVITLGLWLGVTGLSTPSISRVNVPLNFSILNNIEITNSPVQEVTLVLSGDKRKIDQINRSELVASLDLTDVLPGDRTVSLTPSNIYVSLPQGIKLVEVEPVRIVVKLEAVQEKEVSVQTLTRGGVATGYEIYGIVVTPAKIRVRGPASFVKTLDSIQTDKIDLSGKQADFTAKQIPVTVDNPKAAVLNTVVDVYFHIGEKRVERLYTVPITGAPLRSASFVLYGPRTILDRTHNDDLRVVITKDENGTANPEVILPPELRDSVEVRKLKVAQ